MVLKRRVVSFVRDERAGQNEHLNCENKLQLTEAKCYSSICFASFQFPGQSETLSIAFYIRFGRENVGLDYSSKKTFFDLKEPSE